MEVIVHDNEVEKLKKEEVMGLVDDFHEENLHGRAFKAIELVVETGADMVNSARLLDSCFSHSTSKNGFSMNAALKKRRKM